MHSRRVLKAVMVLLRRKASRCSPQHAAMAVTRATPCAGSADVCCPTALNTTITDTFCCAARSPRRRLGQLGNVSHSVDRKGDSPVPTRTGLPGLAPAELHALTPS